MRKQKNLLNEEKDKLKEILYEKDQLIGQICKIDEKMKSGKRKLEDGHDQLTQSKKSKDSSDLVAENIRGAEVSSKPTRHISVISECKFLRWDNVLMYCFK